MVYPEKAKELEICLDTVKVCEKIRKLSKLDRLLFEDFDRGHRHGINRHLLGYLKYCGVDHHEHIKEYFSDLQPYMIERRKMMVSKDFL